MGRKRKKKQKVVAEDRPLKKKSKTNIRNRGITISEPCISDSISIEPTITNIAPLENPVTEQTILTDIPEQTVSVPENITTEQVVSEHSVPENLVSEQAVSEQNASVHIVSEQVVLENIVSE